MTAETRDQLESSRARHAHENGRLRRDLRKTHDRLRLLENTIRQCALKTCNHGTERECLIAASRRVPLGPRKKLR